MQYLVSIKVSDQHDLNDTAIAQLRAAVGQEGLIVVNVADRTRPIELGAWAMFVNELIFWDASYKQEWATPLSRSLSLLKVSVAVVMEEGEANAPPSQESAGDQFSL